MLTYCKTFVARTGVHCLKIYTDHHGIGIHVRYLRHTALLIFSLFLFSNPAPAQQNPEEIAGADQEMEVPFVTIYISARDSSNRFVTNLKPQDFIVKEEGRVLEIQEFTNFSSQQNNIPGGSDVPLNVVFLLDGSESMNAIYKGVKLHDLIKNTIANFMDEFGAKDQMMILGFNQEVWQVAAPTNKQEEIRDLVKKQNARGGQSAVFDAIRRAIRSMDDQSGRKIIVLGSDGVDNASSTGFQEILSELSDSDVTLLAFGTAFSNKISEHGRKTLEFLAESSGGYAFFPDDPEDLDSVIGQVRRAMRTQYAIGYTPPTPTARGRRNIEIVSRIPGVKLRYRRSYVL